MHWSMYTKFVERENDTVIYQLANDEKVYIPNIMMEQINYTIKGPMNFDPVLQTYINELYHLGYIIDKNIQSNEEIAMYLASIKHGKQELGVYFVIPENREKLIESIDFIKGIIDFFKVEKLDLVICVNKGQYSTRELKRMFSGAQRKLGKSVR